MPEEATFLSEPARQLSSLDAVRGLAWACARWALATHPHGFPPFRLPLAPRTHQRRRSDALAYSNQTARLCSVERHQRMIACSGLHRLVLIASHTTPPLSRRVAVPCTRGASGGCDRRTQRPRAQLGSLYSASSAPPLAASRSARAVCSPPVCTHEAACAACGAGVQPCASELGGGASAAPQPRQLAFAHVRLRSHLK